MNDIVCNEDGSRYEGMLVNGKYEGQGTLYDENGNIEYAGQFINGEFEGYGTYFFEDGSRYEGMLINGKFKGQGTLYDENGNIAYKGQYINDNREGQGTLYDENGNVKYEGQFIDGKLEGQGTLYDKNGNVEYEGQFINSKCEGQGIFNYSNGDRYEGQFKDGKREGQGIYCYSNGNRYEGQFKDGKREGHGIVYFPNGYRYEGQFIDGKLEGQGTLYDENGNVKYEGQFIDGKFEGQGTLYDKNGNVEYEGQFIDGKREGQGIFYSSNGYRYEGQFTNGNYNGSGILYFIDGSKFVCKWKNGRPILGNEDLKASLGIIYNILDEIQNAGCWSDDSELSLKELFILELKNFIFFLTASDGNIKSNEMFFINDIFDCDYTLSEINEAIKEWKLTSSKSKQDTPITLSLMKKLEEFKLFENNDIRLMESIVNAYQILGSEFISCDDNEDQWKVSDFTKYINILENNFLHQDTNLPVKKVSIENNSENDNNCIIDSQGNINGLIDELNNLTGISSVKQDVVSLVNLIKIRKMREERGIPQTPISQHMVFYGNPGTGKTTVARLLSKLYNALGLLSKGHLVEVDRSGLVGGYIGQTAIKVKEVIDEAMGGVLFIDEAYSLTVNRGDMDYGKEAVDTLLKFMEDNRHDLIVIVAGYPKLMDEFLESNPGFRSRFNKFIEFEDFSASELIQILNNMVLKSEIRLTKEAQDKAFEFFEERVNKKIANYSNGRDVRNYFEKIISNQANRLSVLESISDDDLVLITIDDVKGVRL